MTGMTPDAILDTYQAHAAAFDRQRGKRLVERAWLDRMLAHAPGRRVLDLGCGSGRPIGQYLFDRRSRLTGVDGAAAMLEMYGRNVPDAVAIHADMRGLALNQRFDVILAWNSFFHLDPDDQRAMFPVFAAHAEPEAALMFTAGPEAGERIGHVDGAPVYHASLAPKEYRALLAKAGFSVLRYVPEDPDCDLHTVWLARYRG